jgi:hypothetical protein
MDLWRAMLENVKNSGRGMEGRGVVFGAIYSGPATSQLPPDIAKKLNRLRILTDNLPKALPVPESREIPKYPFCTFLQQSNALTTQIRHTRYAYSGRTA